MTWSWPIEEERAAVQEGIRRARAPPVRAAIVEAAVPIVMEPTDEFVGGRSVRRIDHEAARAVS
ncbi:MAG: hypothetical protein Q4P07_09695 [Ornithinimicrobium sp.]|uniref:hypothetical protein n=1 Tax=Ornithinimicrobium sp. TaxID=1977084 RepID=UPI0026DFD4F6|nr:hypothetical protein [Ornithinimicrobium sp.]MDO5740408.1 hypothetical protein [Ornithinimicrobium sp.]